MSNPSVRFERLDFLRAIAILMVIALHTMGATFGVDHLPMIAGGRDFTAAPHPAFLVFYGYTYGTLGVTLFFIISGFCIHWSYLRWSSKPREIPERLSLFVSLFYWKRFWRIYPPYLLALLVWGLISGGHLTEVQDWKAFILHACLLHNFNEAHFFTVNPVFWSLAVEMQLYLVYPLVILLYRRFSMPALVVLAIVGIMLRELPLPLAGSHPKLSFAISQLPFYYWAQWMSGAVVAELIFRKKTPSPWAAILLLLGAAIYVPLTWSAASLSFSFYVAILVFALWVWIASTDHRPLGMFERVLTPVGLCSYSLYMYHNLGHFLRPLYGFSSKDAAIWWHLSFGFLLSLAATLTVSWLAYLYIEKPSENLGARLWAKGSKYRWLPFSNVSKD